MNLFKKILPCVVLTVAVLLGLYLLPTAAQAATEGYYTYEIYDEKATITDCNTKIAGTVTVPATLGGYPVTAIDANAFWDCRGLTSITLTENLTEIGGGAFLNCSALKSITIPASVTSIDAGAFHGCRNLTSVYITDLTVWLSISFDEASNPLEYAGGTLYVNGTPLTHAEIPANFLKVPGHAFSGCTSLTSVTIPEEVTSIGDWAFRNCSSLTSITLPDSVTSIGWEAFNGCNNLKTVYYAGSEDQWKQISIQEDNDSLTNATIHYNHVHDYNGGHIENTCICGASKAVADFTGDRATTDADAVYLLRHTLFPEDCPLSGDGDINADGVISDADAVYLLRHTLFPEDYPLFPQK